MLIFLALLSSAKASEAWIPGTPAYGTYFARSVESDVPAALRLPATGKIPSNAAAAGIRALEIYNSPDRSKLKDPATTFSQARMLIQNAISHYYTDWKTTGINPLDVDFFSPNTIARSAQLLKLVQPSALQATFTAGPQTITYEDAFRALLKNWLEKIRAAEPNGPTVGYGNREVTPRVAMCVVVRMYPSDTDPDLSWARGYARKYWRQFIKVNGSDPYEVSGNYSGIGLLAVLQMSDALGNTSLYALTQNKGSVDFPALSDAFFHVVLRYASLVSPAGYMPEMGDDYFSEQFGTVPFVHFEGNWIYIFERVAAMSDGHSSLLYVARKLATGHINYTGAANLPEWTNASTPILKNFRPDLFSALLFRTSYDATPSPKIGGVLAKHAEKIVLRTSDEPGTPMAMIDLNIGDHTHPAERGQIGYYETYQVPQFYNYGRYPQQDYHANKVVLRPAGEMFPFGNGTVASPLTDGLTHVVQTPTSDLLARDYGPHETAESTQFHITHFSAAGSNKGGTASITNPQLMKRDGTTVPLVLPFSGDAYTFPALLVDAKMTGQTLPKEPQLRWFGGPGGAEDAFPPLVLGHHVFDSWLYSIWNPWASIDLGATNGKDNTRVETKGGDTYALVTFGAYGTFDSSMTRQIVLTKEGLLVVVDNLKVGATADGMTAGSLWQIYSLSSDHGADWFAEKGEYAFKDLMDPSKTSDCGFVVKFRANDAATSFGAILIPDGRIRNNRVVEPNYDGTQHIAYAKETLKAGETVCFTLVVVPTPPEGKADFKSIAGNVTWGKPAPGASDAIIKPAKSNSLFTDSVQIETARDGTWKVSRN